MTLTPDMVIAKPTIDLPDLPPLPDEALCHDHLQALTAILAWVRGMVEGAAESGRVIGPPPGVLYSALRLEQMLWAHHEKEFTHD